MGSNQNAEASVTHFVILTALPHFRERGGTWERAGYEGGVAVMG